MLLICLPVIVLALIMVYECYGGDEKEAEYAETVTWTGDY